jgi:hypothetical protein
VGAAPPVKLLRGAHQAEVAFLNQVDQRHTGVGVAPRNGDHQPQIRLDQATAGARVTDLSALR